MIEKSEEFWLWCRATTFKPMCARVLASLNKTINAIINEYMYLCKSIYVEDIWRLHDGADCLVENKDSNWS